MVNLDASVPANSSVLDEKVMTSTQIPPAETTPSNLPQSSSASSSSSTDTVISEHDFNKNSDKILSKPKGKGASANKHENVVQNGKKPGKIAAKRSGAKDTGEHKSSKKSKVETKKDVTSDSGDDDLQFIGDPVDPNEEKWCVCRQVSFGEMICCDNDLCKIEWFHFPCVELVHKPKGKWYCPFCRGERSNILRKS